MTTNTLYYGDNLDVVRKYIPDESVDLVYLDPPFNSRRSYNVLFKEANGTAADSQIRAFDDTWNWGQTAEATLREIELTAEPHIVDMMQAIMSFVGRRNDVTAYLVMMTIRLIELHRALKPTGSIYLHCDPTASHYLKVVMDTIFGKRNFINEVIWHYRGAGVPKTAFARRHDTLLFYAKKRGDHCFNPDPIRQPYADATVERFKHYIGNIRGNRDYGLQQLHPLGKHPDDVISHIQPIAPSARERLGYPTQKPLPLLMHIVQASSNPGDLVLDPFCGCGTTVCAAQKLGRRWMGIDITHLAITLMRSRLHDMFGADAQYEIIGQPADLASARALAQQDRFQFEWWALGLIDARPVNKRKRGADQGLDGVLYFLDESKKRAKKVVVQVKSGQVHATYVRDLRAVVEREKAVMGLLITLESPTKPMLTEALSAGYYHSPWWNRDYHKMQIRTIEELLAGQRFEMPPTNITLAQAERVRKQGDQGKLL